MSLITDLLQAPFRLAGYEPTYVGENAFGQNGTLNTGFDLVPIGQSTPGLDYSQSDANIAKYNAAQSATQPAEAPAPTGGGTTYSGPTSADTKAYYDDQIASLDRLLGVLSSQRDAGLSNINNQFTAQQARLGDQRTKTMSGYDTQGVENSQDKQKGVESVDQFANNSYNSLLRLLQGANAGNSSVARELMPYLVSKSAGTRRQGVFDQAGKNDQAIATARADATDQYNFADEDLSNQRKTQEQSFRQGILSKQNELDAQKSALQTQGALATGAGYNAARDAAAATNAGMDARTQELASLFGQYVPSYTTRAMSLQTPELGKFTVDKANIQSQGQGLPAESSYYQQQILKKKQQGLV